MIYVIHYDIDCYVSLCALSRVTSKIHLHYIKLIRMLEWSFRNESLDRCGRNVRNNNETNKKHLHP